MGGYCSDTTNNPIALYDRIHRPICEDWIKYEMMWMKFNIVGNYNKAWSLPLSTYSDMSTKLHKLHSECIGIYVDEVRQQSSSKLCDVPYLANIGLMIIGLYWMILNVLNNTLLRLHQPIINSVQRITDSTDYPKKKKRKAKWSLHGATSETKRYANWWVI